MRKLVLLMLLVASVSAKAGTQSGTVDYIVVSATEGLVYFALKGGAKNNSPSCATIGYWIIKDENSNIGKLQYSMILSAHASGKTVQVAGMNTCTRWSDGEDVNFIKMVN